MPERFGRGPASFAILSSILNPQSHHWDVGTGVQGYAWGAARPRAVLLLQHGFGEYAERYVRQYGALIPRLLAIGLSVYAFDLMGHGRSPGRRAATDVGRAVADHMAARRNLADQALPVFLFGHSLGGLVTATSVVREPRGVAGVILSSPALHVESNPLTRAFARFVSAVTPILPLVRLDPAGISADPQVVRAFKEDPLVYHGRMPGRLAASVLFTARDNWRHYPRWQLPTLVIHGTADAFTDFDGSRRFVATIGSSDKTLHVVEGGYHELLNDATADETMRVVLTWLERRLPAGQTAPPAAQDS
ncbi:MAG TPA: alpha/beta hydrolase [Tepidisphaeraceae bacterium]|nr:alpha/beta hydrolase [Tepidisphaeraceae bacterium]